MRTAKWLRWDPAYLVLAVLPWLVLAGASSWIYNPLNGIDHWIYFGYFLNYPRYVAELFPDRYYGSRLAWILPGYLLHHLLHVKIAHYVLHLSFYYAAILSLYGVLRRTIGSRTALLTAVLFGTHAFFLAAIGWDYVDGAGITYYLIALLYISLATSNHPRIWLVLGGAAAAAMFYCNAFLIVFVPFLPALYLYQLPAHKMQRGARHFVVWFVSGALFVTVLLGAINYAAGGGFWFYAPSLRFAESAGSQPSESFIRGWSWVAGASWLALPLMTTIGTVFSLTIGMIRGTFAKRDPRLFFFMQFLGCVLIMIAWHGIGGVGLEMPFYASYLLPSAFLAIGCMFSFRFERWPSWIYLAFVAIVAISFAASFMLGYTRITDWIHQMGWIPMAILVGLCFVTCELAGNRWPAGLLAVAGLCLFQASALEYSSPNGARMEAELSRVAESARLIEAHTHEGVLRFWYDLSEPNGTEFNAINSTYLWRWAPEARVGQNFSAIAAESALQPGVEGVLLSGRTDAMQQAGQALSKMNLQPRVLASAKIGGEVDGYWLRFFRLEPLGMSDVEVPLQLVESGGAPKRLELSPASDSAPLPMSRWVWCFYPPTDGKLQVLPDGVHVTTHAGRFSYSAQYPVVQATKSGYYRFVLEYDNLSGGFQYGGLSGDSSHWIIPEHATQRLRNGRGTLTTYGSLAAGDKVLLMVCNFIPQGKEHTSSFIIKSLRAYATLNP